MRHVFVRERPDIVFHAGALKHVPLLESSHNLIEAVRTNVLGTKSDIPIFQAELEVHQRHKFFTKYHPALVSELRAKYPNRAFYMYLEADSAANDVIEPYRANKWADSEAPPPKENFDGFVVPK